MVKKRILGILVLLFLFAFATVGATESSLGVFPRNEEINIIQLCASCTYNNITSITNPNSTVLVEDVVMTRDRSHYNYTLDRELTKLTGEYRVNGVGNLNNVDEVWVYTFEVTQTGTELNTGKSILYIMLTAGVFLLFLLSLYVTLTVPYSNQVDVNGAVFNVTRTKYIKIAFIFLTHILLVWFLNTLIGVSENFVEFELYFEFLGFIFQILNYLSLPMGVFLFVLALFEIVRDANIQKNMRSLMGAMG